jgi:hypothetical protein
MRQAAVEDARAMVQPIRPVQGAVGGANGHLSVWRNGRWVDLVPEADGQSRR